MAKKRVDLGGVQFDDAFKSQLAEQFSHYFEDEIGERLGIFQAEAMVEFFIENMAPTAYNKGLDHAKSWAKDQMEALDIEFDMLYRSVK